MFRKLILAGIFLAVLVAPLRAQTTVVTGTVVDPNGIPYAGATLKASLYPTTAGNFTVTVNNAGQCASAGMGGAPCQMPFTPNTASTSLDGTGSFTIALTDNSLVTPAGTQWLFSISIVSPPPLGVGSVSFAVPITISGASQSVSATLNAVAPSLLAFTLSSGPQLQTNSVNNHIQSKLNFETSTVNAAGYTATPVNPSGGIEQIEITGGGSSSLPSSVDTGVANAYVVTTIPTTTGFDKHTVGTVIGDEFVFIPAHANTGASTINVNGTGVVNLFGFGANGGGQIYSGPFTGAEFSANPTVGYLCTWDGNEWFALGVAPGVAANLQQHAAPFPFGPGASGGVLGSQGFNSYSTTPQAYFVTPYMNIGSSTTSWNMMNFLAPGGAASFCNVTTTNLDPCAMYQGQSGEGGMVSFSNTNWYIESGGTLILGGLGAYVSTDLYNPGWALNGATGGPQLLVQNKRVTYNNGPFFEVAANVPGGIVPPVGIDVEGTGQVAMPAGVGSLIDNSLPTATAPNVTNAGSPSGSTTWCWTVQDGFFDAASTYSAPSSPSCIGSLTSTYSSLSVQVTHTCAPGAVFWNLWRSQASFTGTPAAIGRVNVHNPAAQDGLSIACFVPAGYSNDTGSAADSSAPFTVGTTGQVRAGTSNRSTNPILTTVTPPGTSAGSTGSYGFAFQVQYLTNVTQLGRYCAAADTHAHVVNLWQQGNSGAAIATATVTCASTAAYVLGSVTAVTLVPGNTYFLLVDELTGGDHFSSGWNPTSAFIDSDLGVISQVFGVTGSASTYPSSLTTVTTTTVFSFPEMTMTVASPNTILNGDGKITYYSGVQTAAGAGKAGAIGTPPQIAWVSCTQVNCASSPGVTIGTSYPAADTQYKIHGSAACTGVVNLATAILVIQYTDPSGTVQTITAATATCTALGSASVSSVSTTVRAKANTPFVYYVTQASSPTFEASVSVIQEGTN
jgi:hypothetical protein